MLLPIHIAAGGLAIVLGAVALSAKKGGWIHRRSGVLFVYVMLVMSISAGMLALRSGATGNVIGALGTVYFVVTALTTVRPASPWTRGINIAGLTIAVGLALFQIVSGVQAFSSPTGWHNGAPYQMLFFLGAILTLAAIGDARILQFGMPRGRPRLARHLWRMCFALFIAAGSFFSIRARVATILPDPLTTGPMRALPILLVFAAMFYWLWRLRVRSTLPVLVRHDAIPLVTRAISRNTSRQRSGT
jgi:hypothetical protein